MPKLGVTGGRKRVSGLKKRVTEVKKELPHQKCRVAFPQRMTAVGDTSLKAFKEYLEGTRSPATARKYVPYVRKFLLAVRENGYETLADIPPTFLADYALAVLRNKKAVSTAKLMVHAVKKYLEWAGQRGVTIVTQHKVEFPRQPVRMRSILPTDMFTTFFRYADANLTEPTRTAVMLLPCCGIRSNELLTLRTGDIQPHRVKMKTPKGKPQRYKNTLVLKVRGKGDKERYVPLMEEGVEILRGFLNGWRSRIPGTWLFPRVTKKGSAGRPMSDRHLRATMQKLREPMGLDFTAHTMRRTYITMLWRKNVDLSTIARIAGHASIQTTIDHYIVMEPEDVVKALQDVGDSMAEDE